VKFCQKVKFKIQNSEKRSGLGGFWSSEVRGKKGEIFKDTYI
jgi:hypothetical protein